MNATSRVSGASELDGVKACGLTAAAKHAVAVQLLSTETRMDD
jgi:hypothetical protein